MKSIWWRVDHKQLSCSLTCLISFGASKIQWSFKISFTVHFFELKSFSIYLITKDFLAFIKMYCSCLLSIQHRFIGNFLGMSKFDWFLWIEFAKLRALRAFVPYVPSRLTRLCALVPYVPWFLRALITGLARLICYLHTLLTRDIKSLIKDNFKMF